MRFVLRLILGLMSAFLGFLLLAFITLYWFFQQQSAFDLLVEQLQRYMPELYIESARGNFEQGLQIESLQWKDNETLVSLDAIDLSLDLHCLLRLQICLKTTHINRLSITNLDVSESTEAIKLPTLNMPIPLKLIALDIQEFHYTDQNSIFALSDFSGRLSWYLNTLSYTDVEVQYHESVIDLNGKIKFRKSYPLTLKGSLKNPEVGIAQFEIDGDLDALAIKAGFTGSVPLSFTARLSPLVSPLPWQLDATIPEYTIPDTGYGKANFQQAKLSLKGFDLSMEGQLNTHVKIPLWSRKNTFSSKFSLSGTQLKLKSAQLAVPGGKLAADGIIELGEHFQGNYIAAIRLQAEGINPQLINPELSGHLASEMLIDAVLKQQDDSIILQSINTKVKALSGQLLEWPIQAKASFDWNAENGLAIRQASLSHGSNQLDLRSPWLPDKPLALSLALHDIGVFSRLTTSRLSGSIDGDIDLQLGNDFSRIRSTGKIKLTQFGFDELLIPSATIRLRSSSNTPYSAVFSAQAVSYESHDIGNFDGQLNATDTTVSIDIAAKMTQYGNARITCHSVDLPYRQTNPFTTTCAKIDWRPPADWPLTEIKNTTPIAFSWFAPERVVSVEPFCLKERDKTLLGMVICTEQTTRLKQDKSDVAVRLKGFSWLALKPWLHADWQAEGTVDGVAHINIVDSKLNNLTAKLYSSNSVLHWTNITTPMTIPLTKIELSLSGTQRNIAIASKVSSDDHGFLIADLSIDEERKLGGRIKLEQLKLKTLQAFVTDATEIDGQASANLSISGTVQHPMVQGRLKLEHGVFAHSALPRSVHKIDLDIDLVQDQASYHGQFTVDAVKATIVGNADWHTAPLSAQLNVTSDEFRLSPIPQTELWLTPVIQADWRNNVLTIKGEVTVPRAFINIKSLPKNSIGVSSDAVEINANSQSQTGLDFPIYGDVKVSLGDAVLFRGFGLETLLNGNMLLKYSPQQLLYGSGLIKLIDGHYRAYGQNLRIRNGDLIFAGPIDNPTIQIDAVRNDLADNIIVGLRAEGAAKSPTITLFSQPAMSDQAKLHYLITGQAPGSSTGPSNLLISQAAISLGAETSETLLQEYADMIGLRNLQISTNKRESTTGEGTEVQIGAYLNPDLYIRYGKGVFDNVNSLTMRHRIRSNLFLEAVSSTANSLDLLWTFQVGKKNTSNK